MKNIKCLYEHSLSLLKVPFSYRTEIFLHLYTPEALQIVKLENPDKWQKPGKFLGVEIPNKYESHFGGKGTASTDRRADLGYNNSRRAKAELPVHADESTHIPKIRRKDCH